MAKVQAEHRVYDRAVFETDTHKLELVDAGPVGIAVMTPEWDRMALILERDDIDQLEALCRTWLERGK